MATLEPRRAATNLVGTACLFEDGQITARINREFQDVTLEIDTTVVAANNGAVGLIHAVRSYELLRGQEIDGAIWGIETVDPNVDGLTKDIK